MTSKQNCSAMVWVSTVANGAEVSSVTNSTISRYSTIAIVDSSNDSYIVWVTSSIGISLRESIGNLSEGVGISITVSFTLAIVTTIDTTIAKISTVSNSTISRYSTIAIINSSNDSNIV